MTAGQARNVSRARHRHVVGQGAAGRRRSARGRGSLRPARASRARTRCGASRTPTTGSRASRRRSPRSAAMRPTRFAALAGDRPLGPDARRDPARRRTTSRCGPRSCGTTAARSPNAPSSSAAFPISSSAPATSSCRASPRRRCCGSPRTSPRSPRRRGACCCPRTMCACASRAKPSRRCRTPSGTLWLDVGRRRWDDEPARGDRPDRDAMPSLVEGSEVSAYLSPEIADGLGPRGPQDSDRRRRRRQRRLGDRRRRDRAGRGLRLARHLGRRLLGHRPLRQPARAHAARLLPRAAGSLARHGGDAVGRLLAVLDRRRPRARARHRRLRRRRRRPSPSRRARSRPRRSSCPISAASARRTTTPRRPACSPGLRAEHGADALVFAVHGGRRLLVRRRRRRAGRGRARGRSGRCWSAAARARNSGAR